MTRRRNGPTGGSERMHKVVGRRRRSVVPAGVVSEGRPQTSHLEGANVQLSARNQLNARVEKVDHGQVMSVVRVELPDGQKVTAAITRDAATELGLATGDSVKVVIKATEVMLAKE